MAEVPAAQRTSQVLLNFTSRGVAAVAAACWGTAVILRSILKNADSMGAVWEVIVVDAFAIVNIVAVVIAFSDRRIGGELLVICGSLFAVTSYELAGHNQLVAGFISGGPFMLSGALFLFAVANQKS